MSIKIKPFLSTRMRETVQANNVLLANRSKPPVPELPGIWEIDYDTSDTIFDIDEVPEHISIMGAV